MKFIKNKCVCVNDILISVTMSSYVEIVLRHRPGNWPIDRPPGSLQEVMSQGPTVYLLQLQNLSLQTSWSTISSVQLDWRCQHIWEVKTHIFVLTAGLLPPEQTGVTPVHTWKDSWGLHVTQCYSSWRLTGRQTSRQADRQTDRQADKQTDKQAGRQAGRQTDK